ncbi:hypothetical protein GYMLUDRAFT_35078 [Collybiopsis luxurians FD-317 M1]|nr:hypothetical protein GYMLUDRAFT_35078 [Collybiopsis luxurians FD-317 M1]
MEWQQSIRAINPGLPASRARRLPAEGVQVLRDEFVKGITHPTNQQRAEMLNKLHQMGFTWYKDENIKGWFVNTRSRKKDKITGDINEKLTITIPAGSPTASQSATPSSSTAEPKRRKKSKRLPQFPTIKQSAVRHLAVLVKSSPDSDGLIETWAKLIKADVDDVARWREMYLATGDLGLPSETAPRGPISHGGDGSESEEAPLSAVVKQMNSMIPTAVPHPTAVNPALAHNPYRSLATAYMPPVYAAPPLSPPDQLLLAIHQAERSSPEVTILPQSSSEFETLFAPYQTMMDRFISDIETDKLQDMGWLS